MCFYEIQAVYLGQVFECSNEYFLLLSPVILLSYMIDFNHHKKRVELKILSASIRIFLLFFLIKSVKKFTQ